MFSNLNWYNVVVLVLLALFIFGDKLPKMISDGLRLLRNLRRMAQNATTDLSRELGTEVRLEDLHPKTFVRKHVLSEADQEALLKPLRSVSDDVIRQTRGVQRDLQDVGKRTERMVDELKGAAKPRGSVNGRTGAAADGGTDPAVGRGVAPTAGSGAVPASDSPAAETTPSPKPPARSSFEDVI